MSTSIKKTSLIICPSQRDRREVSDAGICQRFNVVFHEADDYFFEKCFFDENSTFALEAHIKENLAALQKLKPDGIISVFDHPGTALAAIYAQALGLPGANPAAVITIQNKYQARLDQSLSVPEATPLFKRVPAAKAGLEAAPLPYPFFIKPLKGLFSAFARPINNATQWRSMVTETLLPPKGFRRGFNALLRYAPNCVGSADDLIAESLLSGVQITLDGFIEKLKPRPVDVVISKRLRLKHPLML